MELNREEHSTTLPGTAAASLAVIFEACPRRKRSTHEFVSKKWVMGIPHGHSHQGRRRNAQPILRLANPLATLAHVPGGVAGVDHQRRVLNDELVVVGRMVRGDQHTVLRGE